MNNSSIKFAIAIPTRMTSTRFPGKALALLGGMTVLERVYRKCMAVEQAKGNVYILTDSDEIMQFAKKIGAKAILTSPKCNNGTERIVEALSQIDADFIVNVQGDEPFIPTELISALMDKYSETKCLLSTAVSKISQAQDLDNPNIVKVLRNGLGKIIYFSRQALPYQREEKNKSKWLNNCDYFRHIGIYGYSKEVLKKYNDLPESILEKNEFLEQLRFVDADYSFECVETKYLSIGIDTPQDLEEAELYLKKLSQ
ncbi:MAG: 3-deoxy-manno-octulosonate cytidylyltransferase [Opitutales bacterium]